MTPPASNDGVRALERGWPSESPVRLFLWGVITVARGGLTILGYVHLLGVWPSVKGF